MKIKTTLIYHYTPIKMLKIQNTDDTKCCQGCRQLGTLFLFLIFYPHLRTLFSLLLERKEEKETLMRERSINRLPSCTCPDWGWHPDQGSYVSRPRVAHT